MLELIEMLLGV